jgi:sugar phosphate isomerase/epimerase
MKLSFWTLGTPGWPNQAVADAAKRFGYAGVDLRCGEGRNIAVAPDETELTELTALFASRGVQIASILAYNRRGSVEGVDWDGVYEDVVAHGRLAQRAGVRLVRVNAGCPADGEPWEPYLEGLASVLSRSLEATAEDVTFNLQNHPGSVTAVQAAWVAERVNSPRVGVGFSPDHCVDMEEDTVAVARQIAPWIRQVYLADRERLPDGKLKACLPGTGFVPNAEVLEVLSKAGFDGWVSFKWEKPTYPDLPDAEVALPHFIDYMRTLV